MAAAGLMLAAVLNGESVKKAFKAIPGYTLATVVLLNAFDDPLDPADLGDGKPATEITLHNPGGLVIDRDGNVYLADRIGFIWKIDRAGTARIIAGTGRRGVIRDGAKAIETDLGSPEGLALDAQQRLHFADSINNAIFRIEKDGTLRRVAGSGRIGDRGDGGAAIHAALYRPFEIRFDSKGCLYIVDVGNHKIRKVDEHGIIMTVAGTGSRGYSGDEGPATEATLSEPYGAFLDSHDRLLIADSGNNVVRRVDGDGTLRTIAGTTARGYSGDGGPATDARFDSPQFLFVDDRGLIYIGDEHNNAIRAIDRAGSISTVIGTGLNDPEALIVQADGSLLVLDGDHHRLLLIHPDGEIERIAGAAGNEAA